MNSKTDVLLREVFVSTKTNRDFTESTCLLTDDSRIHFCHRVGERWAQAIDAGGKENPATLAGQVLSQIAMFRLNAKHLEIWFNDGSSWELPFKKPDIRPAPFRANDPPGD